jgi:hypothetical protein
MSQVSEWLHSEGVALKAYLQAAGRWEQLEWERVYAWMEAVIEHHKPVVVVASPVPEPEHIVLETPAETVAAASDHVVPGEPTP